jgi:hypothetical protein
MFQRLPRGFCYYNAEKQGRLLDAYHHRNLRQLGSCVRCFGPSGSLAPSKGRPNRSRHLPSCSTSGRWVRIRSPTHPLARSMGPLALGPLRSENVGESVSPPIFAVGKPRTQRLRRRAFSSVGASSNGLLSGHFPSDPPPSSAGEAIVAGTLDWSDTLPGWIGKLRMRRQGADCTWGSAAPITTRHFATSSAASCWSPRASVARTKGTEPAVRHQIATMLA